MTTLTCSLREQKTVVERIGVRSAFGERFSVLEQTSRLQGGKPLCNAQRDTGKARFTFH